MKKPFARMTRGRVVAASVGVTAVIVALWAAGAALGSRGGTHTPPPPAKNFTLSMLDNPARTLSLQSLRGRPVILNFFASWCTPCQKETPLLARFYRGSHGRPLIIGIDANDARRHALAFVQRSRVGYPVVVDPFPGKTAIAYGLPGLPATLFLDSRHRIVRRNYGAVTAAELAAGAAAITGRGR